MKEIFVIWSTDSWHSYSSRELKGVFSSREKAIGALEIHEDEEVCNEVEQYGQSQGNNVNFELEIIEFDKWID